MIGKGLLDEVGMTAIMQAMSAERETAILTLWHEDHGEGAVFFDRGVVVMATVNDLHEQAAFYELSHWEAAAFRLTPVEILPALVGESATVLGMQAPPATPDEGTLTSILGPQKTLLTPDEQGEDGAYEVELVALLSRLDSGKHAIGRRRNRRNPQVILQILTRMLNDVARSAEGILPPPLEQLERALEMARNVYPEAAELLVFDNQINEEALITTFRDLPKSERSRFAPALTEAYLDMFETYFFEFGNLFHGRHAAANWQDTAQLFCGEMKQTLSRVRF